MNNSRYSNFDYELSQKILVLLKGNFKDLWENNQKKLIDFFLFQKSKGHIPPNLRKFL